MILGLSAAATEAIFGGLGVSSKDSVAAIDKIIDQPIAAQLSDTTPSASRALALALPVVDSITAILDSTPLNTTPIPLDSLLPTDTTLFAIDSLLPDSLSLDSLGLDSLLTDSIFRDSLAFDSVKAPRKPFLDAPIFIKFNDSMVYIPATKDIYLHKDGNVKYDSKEMTADYMQLNTQTKQIKARGIADSVTSITSRIQFKDGGSDYNMDSIIYNMDSGKALIHGVRTQEGEGYLFGGTVKKMKDNVTHMKGGRYTTCDCEEPHFYLQMTKGTVVPNKQTVFGPAYMVFEDVPLYPLTIPFGFFPQKREQNSGFIIPEIGEEYSRGFFLRNGGYYFAINDYVDLKLQGSIYTLGSWDVQAVSTYRKRYTFSGQFQLSYNDYVLGEPGSKDFRKTSGFKVIWNHTQDPKFTPGSTFSASVNFSSESALDRYASNNPVDYLNSQTNSTINYSKNWTGTPISLTINGSLNQNTRDSTMSLTLPTLAFNVARVAPFKRKNPIGKERWYEKISFTYAMNFINQVDRVKEYDMFKQAMWDKLKTGINHSLPISASFNVGGVFSISPSIRLNDRMYFDRVEQTWDKDLRAVRKDTVRGFYNVFDFGVSLSMDTKLYGTYTVGDPATKKVSTFRHVLSPSLSFGYNPNFGDPMWGYWNAVQTNETGKVEQYSPYSNGAFQPPGQGQNFSLGFSLGNTLEAKIPDKKDTSGFRKIKIIDQLSISSSYNFIADSLNLSPFSVSLRIPIIKSYTLQLSASFDPYALENERRVNRFMVQDGGFLRLTSLSFSAGYSFKSKASPKDPSSARGGLPAVNDPDNNNNMQRANMMENQDFFARQQREQGQMTAVDRAKLAAAEYYDFSIPWSLTFNYSFNYNNSNGTPRITQGLNVNGSINITDKWAVTASTGFDFESMKITANTHVQITRDLHCWQMSFSWYPIGERQSWGFTIQARSSMLSDMLKWKKDQSYTDNYLRR